MPDHRSFAVGAMASDRSARHRPGAHRSAPACALVVDDSPILRRQLGAVLDDLGLLHLDAASCHDACALLALGAESIDLLITDVQMPGAMDGFGLARHVAEHFPWIDILVSSGGCTPRTEDLSEGAPFIAKPCTGQIMCEHLRTVTTSRRGPHR